MKFTINGQTPQLDDNPMVSKCLAVLDKLPDGELITSPVLAQAAGYALEYIIARGYLLPETYCVKHANKKLYGNQKTIKAWKAQELQG